jgi:hypothetical protein
MTPREAEILATIKATFPGPLVRQYDWVFPAGETIHFIGICLLFGSLIFVDLRLMGFYKQIPVRSVLAFLPYALLGFGLCAVSGWLFFTSNPSLYYTNTAFLVKMGFVALGGLNALIFTIWEHPKVVAIGPGEDVPAPARLFGGISLLLWFAVLLTGRWLPLFTVSVN